MNREQRRRQAKEVAKGNISIPSYRIGVKYVDPVSGQKFDSVNDYIDHMEREIAKQSSQIAAEIMWECENYIQAGMMLGLLLSVKKSQAGKLKTVQRSYQEILDNFNESMEYIDKNGIRETYEELKKEMGINLEFDDFDINTPFDDEEHYKRLKVRIDTGR